VLVDTREKLPWTFFKRWRRAHLDAGDYTLAGLGKQFAIERKGSVGELVANFTHDWPRFEASLKRLQTRKHRAIIVEASFAQVLRGSTFSRAPDSLILGRITYIQLHMDIPMFFLGRMASVWVPFIFSRFYQQLKEK